ncbi:MULTISPECIES: pyridoxal-phosphate dependent enzyme [unclassified Halomonas]|uniref:pyridoxal-phosphate dependent enzyme n=1 Tax=unclassified Halomonas TaxID=2609666 RepID=UPI000AF8C075|nr:MULTISPECIES: pyridoxal-phosphate dependent enzyme [unclassified Halomonas]MBT2786180.1 pyridoxal-phosphate dependent enzyme [Halomonas sp. ISL-106]MBT2797202.1 pyridoxal-phosphate dependent enzyme [Halomonas sp. ISL-104]
MSQIRTILTEGDPRLRAVSQPVEEITSDIVKAIAELHATLADFKARTGFGRALSAPQIGEPLRIVAVQLGGRPFTLINPVIVWRSEETQPVWDDCMSVPNHIANVRRHASISLTYQDDRGKACHWNRLSASLAELIQHEVDHLDGVLMVDRIERQEDLQPIAHHAELIAPQRSEHRIKLEHIAAASRRINPTFLATPQYRSPSLDTTLRVAMTLKVETLNPLRNFKGRGADHFVSHHIQQEKPAPLVCASAGNWGLALAHACKQHELPLSVFVAENANPLKIAGIRALGAEVISAGEDFDQAKQAAARFAQQHGSLFVEDGRQAEITEGAGTIAVEMLAHGDTFDTLLVPLGNGALINGVGRWFKASSPATRVIGICPQGADATWQSWKRGTLVTNDRVNTMADGVAVRAPIIEALEDMRDLVDDIWLVDETSIEDGMRLGLEHLGLLLEPAGALGLAAAYTMRDQWPENAHVATILTGANPPPTLTDSLLAAFPAN